MSIDAGSAFVLQFSSVGAVRTQTRATEVGRAVESVTRQMRQARTAFSQVAGVTNQLGRVFGLNLGVQAIAGAMSGRAVSALGLGGSGRELEPGPQRIGQLAEAVAGLASFVGISIIQQQIQQRVQERQQRLHDRAVARQIATQDRNQRRQERALTRQTSTQQRQQRQATAVRQVGGAATTVATVATGARIGSALGPIGAMVGSIVAFVAAGVIARMVGDVSGNLAQDAIGTERGAFREEHRREIEFQRLRFATQPERRSEMQGVLGDQRRRRVTRQVRGEEGAFGRVRGTSALIGDGVMGPLFPVNEAEGGLRLTILPGTQTAVERRVQELEQRIIQMEQERQRQTGEILDQMRRAQRL